MVTLQTARRDVAEELGLLDVVITSGVPTGDDANRTLLVPELADAVATTLYDGAWAYPVAGAQSGQQRAVRGKGISTSPGGLVVTRDWAAPIASGVEVELHRLIPARRALGRNGWLEILNATLRDIPIERRWAMTATAGTTAYTTVPAWFETEAQAIGLYDPTTGAENPMLSDNLRGFRFDGGTLTVELWSAYSAGSVFNLALHQPAATRVRAAGVWTDSTAGLVNETDEVPVHRTLLKAMAIERAARQELTRPDPRYKLMWEVALSRWQPVAARLKAEIAPKPRPSRLYVAPMSAGASWPKQLDRLF